MGQQLCNSASSPCTLKKALNKEIQWAQQSSVWQYNHFSENYCRIHSRLSWRLNPVRTSPLCFGWHRDDHFKITRIIILIIMLEYLYCAAYTRMTMNDPVDRCALHLTMMGRECSWLAPHYICMYRLLPTTPHQLGLELNAVKCDVIRMVTCQLHTTIPFWAHSRELLWRTSMLERRLFRDGQWTRLSEKTEKMEKVMTKRHLIQFNDALSPLRNSNCVPKLLYTLRTSECSDNRQLMAFDKLQRQCITDVINVNMSYDQ